MTGSLKVTTLFAGLLGFLMVILTMNVIRVRQSEKITIGAGSTKLLELRIRA
jgi:uncharacterized membrane protein YecN with MAPEG domain